MARTQDNVENQSTLTNNIREVFTYIHRFKHQVFVLKIDDALLETPLFALLIRDIVLIHNMGIKVILVPGSQTSIDQILSTYGIKTEFSNGIRITTDEAMPLVKLGCSNVAYKILTLLSENGAHGVMGNWVRARSMGVLSGIDFHNTGNVDNINVGVIDQLLNQNHIPILTNIGWSNIGLPYNISSNELAVALAKRLHAAKLFFITTGNGIPQVKDCKIEGLSIRDNGVYSSLNLDLARQLLHHHQDDLPRESAALINYALQACSGGVNRTHIINGSQDGILLQEIFSTTGKGTMFHANQYANIRLAKTEDIPIIMHIMQPYVEKGILVQRSADELAAAMSSIYVYSVDEALQGCGVLTMFPEKNTAELKSIVVDPACTHRGIGKKLVSFFIKKAGDIGCKSVFLLTTQSEDFFMNLGFRRVPLDALPQSRKKIYNKDRNSKVLIKDL